MVRVASPGAAAPVPAGSQQQARHTTCRQVQQDLCSLSLCTSDGRSSRAGGSPSVQQAGALPSRGSSGPSAHPSSLAQLAATGGATKLQGRQVQGRARP